MKTTQPNRGDTEHHVASMYNKNMLIQFLRACRCDDTNTIYSLLYQGFNPNITLHNGMTPLMWAVDCRSVNTVILLLQFGANPTTRNSQQETALSKAIANGHSEIQSWLMFYQRHILAAKKQGFC